MGSARSRRALPALLQLLASVGGSKAGEAAMDSLVNLSQDAALVVLDAVAVAMDVVAKRGGVQSWLVRSLVMLLVSLTHAESDVAALLQVCPTLTCLSPPLRLSARC